jgi:hypothetical protein
MLAYMGEAGRSHGLQFFGDRDLLRCSATVSTKGTFGLFARSVDSTLDLTGKALSLRDLISLLPELRHDFPLLKSGRPSVVAVKIVAWIQGDMFLRFLSPDYLREEFDARWSEMFFWFKDICELDPNTPFTLRVKEKPLNETAIGDFCRKYLFGELEWRPDAVWYDHIARDNVPLVKRLPAYLAALFILSNVVRYEPELVEPPSLDSTDLGYVITELLNSAERYFPQLVLELVMGQPWFFE